MNRTPPRYEHITFVASPSPEAQTAYERLTTRYGKFAPEAADVIVALGATA